jgi:hypothetical protein
MQVLFHQLCRADAQVASETVDVDVTKYRAGCLAAIGTRQAINFLKDLIVQIVELLIEVSGRPGFELAEELLVRLLFLFGAFDGLLYVHW